MLTYCLKCIYMQYIYIYIYIYIYAKNKDAKIIKIKNVGLALSSKCVVCGSRKSILMKEQEAEGLLSNLGTKIPLSKIQLLNILF